MRPRRTVNSDGVLRLPGGNEDNDLWYQHGLTVTGIHAFLTVWEFTEAERRAIMEGQNLQLALLGDAHPPVILELTDVKLGRQ
jgi:hypothetical protein